MKEEIKIKKNQYFELIAKKRLAGIESYTSKTKSGLCKEESCQNPRKSGSSRCMNHKKN